MMKSHAEVCGTPNITHFFSGAGPPTVVQPIFLSSHPQNRGQAESFFSITLDIYVLQLFFAAEVLTDEILPVYGVVSHIELHYVGNGFIFREIDSIKSHTVTDKVNEFVRRNLSKTFESCDFHAVFQFLDGVRLFFIVVAVSGFFKLFATSLLT